MLCVCVCVVSSQDSINVHLINTMELQFSTINLKVVLWLVSKNTSSTKVNIQGKLTFNCLNQLETNHYLKKTKEVNYLSWKILDENLSNNNNISLI